MKPWGLKLAMNVPVVICQTWGLWSESRTSCSNQQRLEKNWDLIQTLANLWVCGAFSFADTYHFYQFVEPQVQTTLSH